ncbi:out at first protein-like [Gigantopelta aegis]|uniref:out at first protein-like n=1 Tax=Gigantopelta aegis TaxID=1735272 RepID=UPI001B88C7D8|nr:out at first protein-like [Gigantopelta aegis]
MMKLINITLFTLATLLYGVSCQLVVNVKDEGGDVLVESIHANTSSDTLTLEFQNTDGTLVTQFIDFKSEAQIFRAYVPAEEELGQSQYQVLCFVTRFSKTDFISSDAMSKLRQKNPTAIRTPEEQKGPEMHIQDLLIDINKGHLISPHLYNICQDAVDTTYFQENDLKTISRSLGKDYTSLMTAVKRLYPLKYPRCKDVPSQDSTKICLCRYTVCVGWYPCGLKYCRGKDSTGKVVNYRCGIKTCKKCIVFEHVAKQKLLCLWDNT